MLRQTARASLGTLLLPLLVSCAGGSVQPNASGCHTHLDLWSVFGSGTPQNAGIGKLVQQFTRDSSGCTMDVTVIPGNQLGEKLTAAVAGGTPPALSLLPPGIVSTWSVKGLLAAVDDLFKRAKLSATDFPAPLWQEMSYGGKVWFLPLFANGDFVLFWNKQHFQEVGLSPDQGPQTISELNDMMMKLTVQRNGRLQRLGAEPWDVYGPGNPLQAWGYAFGGSFYDQAKDTLTFNNPQVVSAVQWYTGWARRMGPAPVQQLLQQAAQSNLPLLGTGLVSIAPLTSPNLRMVQAHAPSLQLGVGVLPGQLPGKPGSVTIGGWATGAVAGSAQREAAWEFMRFAGVSDTGTMLVAQKIGIPGYLKSPGLTELSKDHYQGAYVAAVRRAQHVQISLYAPVSIDLKPIQDVIDGKQSARTAMDIINETANAAVKQLKQQLQKAS